MSRQREWQRRQRTQGLCEKCPNKNDGGSLCTSCRAYDRARPKARTKDRTKQYERARLKRLTMRAMRCYKRRCSVCSRLGHNRRTCPQVYPQGVE